MKRRNARTPRPFPTGAAAIANHNMLSKVRINKPVLWHRRLRTPGGAVSESGCLCQREEGHGGGLTRRSVLMVPTLTIDAG